MDRHSSWGVEVRELATRSLGGHGHKGRAAYGKDLVGFCPCCIPRVDHMGEIPSDMLYYKYFSTTVKSRKKTEFLSVTYLEGMSMAKYQARFLTLESFSLGSFTIERERVYY